MGGLRFSSQTPKVVSNSQLVIVSPVASVHSFAFDEHVHRGKTGVGNAREMDFESFLDFVLALENKDTPEGLTYLFRCFDLQGRGYLTTADIHSLFRDVHQKLMEGGNYELCIEERRFGIW